MMRAASLVLIAALPLLGCADERSRATSQHPTAPALPQTMPVEPLPFTTPAAATAGDAVLVGAGNIARCDGTGDDATAALLDGIAGTVFTLGDNVYPEGSAANFASCYEPTWGRHVARTRPAPGDVDYLTVGGGAYYDYFGAAAGPAGRGFYAYDAGAWRVIVLNSAISKAPGSTQERWLRSELAANPRECIVAYWHHPLFWSGTSGSVRDAIRPLWDALYEAGADIVVNAHNRNYERFARQRPDGTADPERGIRQFIVGTGGYDLGSAFGAPLPNSEVRSRAALGVLKLTLRANGYSWEFVPRAGGSFTDSGDDTCGVLEPPPAQPNRPPVAHAGGPYSATVGTTISFDGTASYDPDDDVLGYAWTFGDGGSATGPQPTHAFTSAGTYTVTLTVTDAHGATSQATTAASITQPPPPPTGAVLVGAGNIARCDRQGDEVTAALLDAIAGTVMALGDNAYPGGSTASYANCYNPTWGRHRERTYPAAGNHDYGTAAAAPYFQYFGARAGDPGRGYYSYDLGGWHIVVLNSNKDFVSTSTDSEQLQWLRADLAAAASRGMQCTLAYWHHPRFYQGGTTSHRNTSVLPFWKELYAAGAEVVVNAHFHLYERYAPQRPDGTADPERGIRQFIVGTGGYGHDVLNAASPNVEVRNADTWGVLKLTLEPGAYTWEFVPEAGRTFTDTGRGTCR
jgi:PKD repeat protein